MQLNHLVVEERPGLLGVTVNRPAQRNALCRATLAEIRDVFQHFASDKSIHAALLTGAGEKAFCAGGDLHDFDKVRSQEQTEQMSELGFDALKAIKNFPVPVVAAINGVALGGGAELAIACDRRIANTTARIGFIQARLGISTAWGGSIYLAEQVGETGAAELTSQAAILDASEAEQLGLFDAVALLDQDWSAFLQSQLQGLLDTPRAELAEAKTAEIVRRQAVMEPLRAAEKQAFIDNWLSPEHWRLAEQALKQR